MDDAAAPPQQQQQQARRGRRQNQWDRGNQLMTPAERLSVLEEMLINLPKHRYQAAPGAPRADYFIEEPRLQYLAEAAGDRALIDSEQLGEEDVPDGRLAAISEVYFNIARSAAEQDCANLMQGRRPNNFHFIPQPLGIEQFALEMMYGLCDLLGLSEQDAWPANCDGVQSPIVLDTYSRGIALIGVPLDLIKSQYFFDFLSDAVRRKLFERAIAVFFTYIQHHFVPWITDLLGCRVNDELCRRMYARIYHFRKYMDTMLAHYNGRLEIGFASDNLAKAELLRQRILRIAEEENVRIFFFGKSGIVLQRLPRLGPNGVQLGFFDYYKDYSAAAAHPFDPQRGDNLSDESLATASTLRRQSMSIEEWLHHGPLNYERCQRDGSFWYCHVKMESRDTPVQILRSMTDLRVKPVRLTKQQWKNGTFDLALWKFFPFDGPTPPPEINDYSAAALFPYDDFPIPDLIRGSVDLETLAFVDHPALQTPAFDKVFADQGFPPGSPMYIWILSLLGRLQVPFGTPMVIERGPHGGATRTMSNDLTLMIYLYGKGGSGKSTVADAMRYIFSDGGAGHPMGLPTLTPRVVSSLSNSTEDKFALAKAKDGLVLIAAEITDKFNMESTMLLKMLEGGTVEIMAKYETEHDFSWHQPILFCGNKNFLGKKNNNNDEGQLSRRITLIEFLKGEQERAHSNLNPLNEVRTRERAAISLKTALYFRALLKTMHDHNIADRDRRIASALARLPAPLGPMGQQIYDYLQQQDLKNQPWFQDLKDLFTAEDGPLESEPEQERFLSEREFNRRMRQENGGQVVFDQDGQLVGMPVPEGEVTRDKYELEGERENTEWRLTREQLRRVMTDYFKRIGVKTHFNFADVAGSFRHVKLFPSNKDGIQLRNGGAYYFGYRLRGGYYEHH